MIKTKDELGKKILTDLEELFREDCENEIWTEMWNFPNYEVSNLGRVRRAKNGKLVKIRKDGNDYNFVCLFYNKKKYTKRLGKLIWQSFNKCDCNQTIDHLDRKKMNDNLGNLRCISMEDNYKNRITKKNRNKYNLTPEIKALIYRNHRDGVWTNWSIMKKYGMPLNYVRTTMIRGSWKKYGEDENL
jgi:hypothetical protein